MELLSLSVKAVSDWARQSFSMSVPVFGLDCEDVVLTAWYCSSYDTTTLGRANSDLDNMEISRYKSSCKEQPGFERCTI